MRCSTACQQHAGRGSYDTPFDGKAELIDLTYPHRLSLSGGIPINSCGNKPWLRLSDPPSGLEWVPAPLAGVHWRPRQGPPEVETGVHRQRADERVRAHESEAISISPASRPNSVGKSH